MADALVYLAGGVLLAWGTAHIVNTRPVVDSFGEIGIDNRRIFTLEWIAEGLTHVTIALLAVLVAAAEGSGSGTATLVYRVLAGTLVVFAGVTAFTGARTRAFWFKLCPFILSGAAALLLARTII